MNGLIIGDNFDQTPRTAIGRSNGAHRIASVLRTQNIQVEVLDFFNSWEFDELKLFIDCNDKFDFLGISLGLSYLDSNKVTQLISYLKIINSEIKIIAGGSNVLQNYHQNIDYYFQGFAEGAVNDIVKYLKTGKINPFTVSTIKTHDEKKVVDCNHHYKIANLENLKNNYVITDFIQTNETLTLETGRGCIFKCKFCNFPFTGKKKDEYIRDKQNIKQELIENYLNWGTTKYLITDDTFNDNPLKVDFLYEIAQEIDFKLSLMCYARIDLLHHHESQLEKMIDFGIRGCFFGIESLKPQTSRLIGKGFTGDKLKNYLLKIRNQYPNLHITTSFIVGLPQESLMEFEDNLDWMIKNKATDTIQIWPLQIPIDNNINYLSDFTKDWQKYGYEYMTEDEKNLYTNIPNLIANLKTNEPLDIKDYSKHRIPWKNKEMNFIQAMENASRINRDLRSFNTLSGWFGFAHSFHTSNLDSFLFAKKTDIDWNVQKSITTNFINDYKSRKIKRFI